MLRKATIFIILFTVVLALPVWTQNQKWGYVAPRYSLVNGMLRVNDTLWVATNTGLCRLNLATQETTHYDPTNSQLPGYIVSSVVRDSAGVVWVGTHSGLAGIDGGAWTVYTPANSNLPSNPVHALCVDPRGRLVISTWDGPLFRMENRQIKKIYEPPFRATVKSIISENDSTIWCATSHGLLEISGSQGKMHTIFNSGLPWNDCRAVVWYKNEVWVGTGKGLTQFDGSRWRVYNRGLPSSEIRSLAAHDNADLWVGTTKGLARFQGSTYTTQNSSIPYDYIGSLYADTTGELWLGLAIGLVQFNNAQWLRYKTGNSEVPSEHVRAISFDASGGVWIGTDAGLAVMRGKSWEAYTVENGGLFENVVNAIAFDSSGKAWVGTSKGIAVNSGYGFYAYTQLNTVLPDREITALIGGKEGDMWIGTASGGLIHASSLGQKLYNTETSGIPSNRIRRLAMGPYGELWIATANKGVVVFNQGMFLSYNAYNSDLPEDEVLDITVDDRGTAWALTNSALSRIRNGVLEVLPKEAFKGNRGVTVDVDGSGTVWIGTYFYGLIQYRDTAWTIIRKEQSMLPHNRIDVLRVNSNGDKWIATNAGIAIYNENGVRLSVPSDERAGRALSFRLFQNYPNPLSTDTWISLWLKKPVDVELTIRDINGKVITKRTEKALNPGIRSFHWNAVGIDGAPAPAGVYFYSLKVGRQVKTKKMVIVR